jgi:uncharacterized protein YutD
MEKIKLILKQLFCKHKPIKKYLDPRYGYCTFGAAYFIECEKCGKRLGKGIDRY